MASSLNGNLHGYTDSVMGTWVFSYDQLNRLVTAANTVQPPASVPAVPAPGWSPYFCWAYDAFGNRLQQSQSDAAFTSSDGSCTFNGTDDQNVIASYNAQNQITSTNAPGFTLAPPTYDNAGDVTYDGKNSYLYDAEGRLCAVESDGSYTGYLYDASGNRVAKGTITSWSCDITTNGFTQTAGYVVGPNGEQLTEVDANNNWVHTNVYTGGKLIGTYDGNVSAPTLHYYFDDPLGTRRAQTNAVGVLEAVYVSLPFGDGYASNSTAGVTDPTENHFTGKERDSESGNDYFLARYYNSTTGRFLSPDWSAKSSDPVPYAKLDNPQSLNLYSYVLNHPINYADPDGHCCWDDAVQWTKAHPRTMQAATGVGEIVAGIAGVGFSGVGEMGSAGTASVPIIFAVQASATVAVKGVTDIAGAATNTNVSRGKKGLDSVSNPAGQVRTAMTGNVDKGATTAAQADAAVGIATVGIDIKELINLTHAGRYVGATDKATGIANTAVESTRMAKKAFKNKKKDQDSQ